MNNYKEEKKVELAEKKEQLNRLIVDLANLDTKEEKIVDLLTEEINKVVNEIVYLSIVLSRIILE